eukprot:scaffold1041_cov124-Isochrysis_galbana.AAC.15
MSGKIYRYTVKNEAELLARGPQPAPELPPWPWVARPIYRPRRARPVQQTGSAPVHRFPVPTWSFWGLVPLPVDVRGIVLRRGSVGLGLIRVSSNEGRRGEGGAPRCSGVGRSR